MINCSMVLIQIKNQLLQRLWLRRSYTSRIILSLVLLGSIVRSLPYLAPIRAADLVQEQQALTFSDRNGLPLGTLLTRDQDHTAVVPLKQISPHFIQAILAAEDGRFYQHGPLEMRSIIRAVIQAIQSGEVISGASTITMQLARMLEPAPRNLGAKIQEIWLSWRLAAGMSKDDILQAYINRLPMGGNIYGVEAAARIYFGVPAADLNLAQASLLAALPNNPTYLNPYEYWQPLKLRQKYVLNRMFQDGYITQSQVDKAYDTKVTLSSRGQGIIAAPHFLFWLANQLPQNHPSQIRTTIDRSLQQFVEAQLQQVINSLAEQNVHQGAALVIDNQTGEVLAYVGSADYFSLAQLGRNDGVQSLRQPGSTLKPFLYQLALEKRIIRPNTVLADIPTYYPIPGARLYSPTDYTETFQGPVRIRIALANSLNIPAVRVLEEVRVPNFLERLRQLGFRNLDQPPEYYGLGLTLGSGEVSLWELARAYLTLAKQGQFTPIFTNFAPCKEQSEVVCDHPSLSETWQAKIGSESTWELITDMLSDRHARAKSFGVDSVLNLPFPTAVKTGTSSNFRDTWTVGFTSDYTVATWVGNFSGEPMVQVSGVMGAAPLWQRIMLYLHQHDKPHPFSPPKDMVQLPVCALSGLKPTSACPSVVQEYFSVEDIPNYEANEDTFYQLVTSDRKDKSPQYRLNLPEEYDEWLAKQQQPTLTSSQLRILSPSNGDVFLLQPNEVDEAQTRLEFKLAGVLNQPVEWWLNGQKLTSESSNSIFWQLRPGEWTLKVKSGIVTDQVSFQVEVAEHKLSRRGFSVGEKIKD